ncbi:MAG: hypothetical protein GEU92_13245 [Alphaproteobacteria bacterium]|nr:hypothetical protein [Alphaproteobacteria bacterium]
MNRKLDAITDALAAAGLAAFICGVCVAAGDYLVLVAGERLLERWSVLPAGWGEAHMAALGLVAGGFALLPAGAVFWWMYRSARRRARDGDGPLPN